MAPTHHLEALAVTLLLAGCCCAPTRTVQPPAPTRSQMTTTSVLSVTDGDTLKVSVDGTTRTIRLKGINAPEKGECQADASTQALEALVSAGVKIEGAGDDTYGRWLAYLWTADGVFVQHVLVSRGLALAYPYGDHDAQTDALAAAQRQAERTGAGMFDPRACGAGSGIDIRIVAVDANPEGDDVAENAGESVTLEGPPGADLGGWTVKDTSASHRLRLPAGTTLDSRGRLRVYTSCGAPRDGVHHACVRGSAVWNNGGDTAFLLDPNGNIVSRRVWRP